MRKFLQALIALFFFLIPYLVLAETITWQSAIKEVHNNDELQAAIEAKKSSYLNFKANQSGYYPQILAEIAYQKSGGRPISSPKIFDSSEGLYSTSIELRQNIFAGFLINAKVNEARSDYEIQVNQLRIVRSKVSHDLKRAFAELLFAQQSHLLAQKIVLRRKNNLSLVELRHEGGRENKGSFLLAKAALAQAHFEQQDAEQFVSVARQKLIQILGRDSIGDISVHGEVPETLSIKTPPFKELALNTPEWLQEKARVRAAQARAEQTASKFWPSVDLSGSVSKTDDRFLPKEDNWQVSLTLNIPLFAGGQDYFEHKSKNATAVSTQAKKRHALREILTNLKEKHHLYVLAKEKVIVNEAFLQAAQVRAKISRGKYGNGLMTFEDWDIIENDLIEREKLYIKSQREKIFAGAVWELTQGKGIFE